MGTVMTTGYKLCASDRLAAPPPAAAAAAAIAVHTLKQEFVRPRWSYDMRPSVRAEKYIRDAGP